jgi:glycerophosphoryl diester phosphodiesterase
MWNSRYAATLPMFLLISGSLAAAPPPAIAPFDAPRARELQHSWAKQHDREIEHTNSLGMKLMILPPGEFTMGLTNEYFDDVVKTIRNDPKLKQNLAGTITWSMLMMPGHRVRITKPFYVGATEVTVGQFRQFSEASGYKTEAEWGLNHGKPIKGRAASTWKRPMAWCKPPLVQHDDEPVLHLCWNDCIAFCKWLSEKEGVEYGLPTEAQWEYACRAGTTTPWHFSDRKNFDRVSDDYAYWSDGKQGKHTKPRIVAKGKPNAFGLYDMHGNVWEYTNDWWHRLTYKDSPLNDPVGPALQSEKNDMRRIIRGSSFDWGRHGGDSAYRMRITQRSTQHPHMGFRVMMKIANASGIPLAVDPKEKQRRVVRDADAKSKAITEALPTRDSSVHRKELSINLGKGLKMDFVLIPAGTFLMGSTKGANDERPLHSVVISKPFYMAKHEVSQQQWETLMGPDPWLVGLRKEPNDLVGPNKPMYTVSWTAAGKYLTKLKARARHHNFALPTEAQWEYACRADSTTEFSFGNEESQLGEHAHYAGNKRWPGEDDAHHYYDVATKKPNKFGLFDMHGGVWEWCSDRYNADYYLTSPMVDPDGPQAGRFRVLRGGSWFRRGNYARSAYRRFFHPDGNSGGVTAWINDFGVRPVINLSSEETATQPLIVAHRGLLRHAPENTLANFRACLELRLGFEFDVRRSKDGHLVCVHDETVNRTSDGTGKVTELTLAQLKKLDAGSWFGPEFANERVPTIDEVFALLAQHRNKRVLAAVDMKGDDPQIEADVVRLANKHKVLDKLLFIGRTINTPEVRKRLRKADAKAHVATVANTADEFAMALNDADSDWVYVRYIPSREEVRRAKGLGKPLFIAGSTVAGEEKANWIKVRDVGVIGILTDHPLTLHRTLRERRE